MELNGLDARNGFCGTPEFVVGCGFAVAPMYSGSDVQGPGEISCAAAVDINNKILNNKNDYVLSSENVIALELRQA